MPNALCQKAQTEWWHSHTLHPESAGQYDKEHQRDFCETERVHLV